MPVQATVPSLPAPFPALPTVAEHVRCLPCTSCWARVGQPCAVTAPPREFADHLRRYLDAERGGLITRAELLDVLAPLDAIACTVVIPEAAA